MKMNMSLIRDLLIYFQDNIHFEDGPIYAREIKLKNYSTEAIMYHIALLNDGGYIEYEKQSGGGTTDYYVRRLTFDGHQFLALISNNKLFTMLKEVLKTGLPALPALLPLIQPYIPQLLGLLK